MRPRFTVGLAKKVLLANSIGALWDAELAAQSAGMLTAVGGWLGIAAFGFQIYFDFSGYSDMAIGMGRMLGFHFPENFATSLYRRLRNGFLAAVAHFPDYMVPGVPLHPAGRQPAGTRPDGAEYSSSSGCAPASGTGQAGTFILWGLHFFRVAHAGKVSAAGFSPKAAPWLRHSYTLVVVFAGWGIFAMEDLSVCGGYFRVCFGGGALWSAVDGLLSQNICRLLVLLNGRLCQCPVKAVWDRLPERAREALAPVLMLRDWCSARPIW